MMEIEKKAGGDEQQICKIKKWRCSNVSGDNEHQFCEKHYKIHKDFLDENPSLRISKKSKQAKMKEKKKKEKKKKKKKEIIIPTDEERCCRSDRVRWRCKNFRMPKSVDGPDTTYCEKHYYALKKSYQLYLQRKKLKKTDADDGDEDESDDSDSDLETWDSRCSKQRKRGDDNSTREIQPPTTTTHTSSDRTAEADDSNIDDEETRYPHCIKRRKLTEIADPVAIQPPATNHPIDTNSDTIIEEAEEPMVIPADTIIQEAEEPVVEVESFEHYKSKCFELSVELEKKQVELEKKTVECTELQGRLEEVERTKTADEIEYWRKKCSDLESENLTLRSVPNLESQVLRNGKDGSLLRCEQLPSSEKIIESEVRGSQNETTSSGEIPRDENNMNKHNVETSSGGNKDPVVDELKTEKEVLNVNDWGCKERPSQAHLEMSEKIFVDLVSDSDDGGDGLGKSENTDTSVDPHTSVDDPAEMLVLNKCIRNIDEMTWKSEADMLASFKEDSVLCMKAVCALYRQKIYEDEIPPKGLFFDSDTSRCIDLAKFLMDGDCKGDLKKSVKELETLDPTAVDDCRKLAVRYSVFIFDFFESKKDPFFFPATTAAIEM